MGIIAGYMGIYCHIISKLPPHPAQGIPLLSPRSGHLILTMMGEVDRMFHFIICWGFL